MGTNELPVPGFGQAYWWYCGFACVQMVLAYNGKFRTQEALARVFPDDDVLKVREYLRQKRERDEIRGRGIYTSDIVPFLRSFGLIVRGRRNLTVDDLCSSIDNGVPPIARTKIPTLPHDERLGHFIVVKGYTPTALIVNDPGNLERERISFGRFKKLWNYSYGNYSVFARPSRSGRR